VKKHKEKGKVKRKGGSGAGSRIPGVPPFFQKGKKKKTTGERKKRGRSAGLCSLVGKKTKKKQEKKQK